MSDDQPDATARFRLRVDDACITTGQCVLIDAELFGFDDNGVTRVLVAEVPAEKLAAATEAVANCPIGAIHLDRAP